MKIPHKPGVYCLKAHNSKLIYIGSSKNVGRRKNIHMYSIRKNLIDKGCKAIIDAYFLGDYVSFEVIELCENYLDREQFWLEFYTNQNEFSLINVFDADRNNSKVPNGFREKMSAIRTEKWKDPKYRNTMLDKISKTHFTSEQLSKVVHHFSSSGDYLGTYFSAKTAAILLGILSSCVSGAARGKFGNSFKYKNSLFIYDEVLYKLDELLETHQELRAISSEAWEACKSTKNVQRLMSEQSMQ